MAFERNFKRGINILLTGGGTGGHVIPCVAIYEILKENFNIRKALYLGLKGKAEDYIVPSYNIPLHYINSSPFAGFSFFKKIRALLKISRGVFESMLEIIRFKPNLIVAAGGYVSAPVVVAGFLLKPFFKYSIVLDEQNLVPGLLNKVASLFADTVFVNFKESVYFIWSNHCVYTGYPVRKEYRVDYSVEEEKRKLGFKEKEKIVLITGGSIGARTINKVVANSIENLAEFKDTVFVHSIGLNSSKDYNAFEDTVKILQSKGGLRFEVEGEIIRGFKEEKLFYIGMRFIRNIFEYQKASDLIVSRAGAGAISEILALSKAALLIPKRGLPGDHQELNAIGIAEKGGCEVLFERRIDGEDCIDKNEFVSTVSELLARDEVRKKLSRKAGVLFYDKTEEVIVDTVRRLLNGEKEEINFLSGVYEPEFVKFQRYFDNLVHYLDAIPEKERSTNLYARFYSLKIDEYLGSQDFMVVNRGIKLIGSLRLNDRYEYLYRHFDSFKGFLRRNVLIAFKKSDNFYEFFAETVKKGLQDSYFEVRREAISLFIRFFREMSCFDEIKEKILEKIYERFESFEVICEAIKASALILDEDRFISLNRRFLTHRNVRIREAILDAVRLAMKFSSFEDVEKLSVFLKKMLITTSEFKPVFSVRQKYFDTLKALEGKND